MEHKLGVICMLVGIFWVLSSIAALIFGLIFLAGVEDTILSPTDFTLDTINTVYNDIVGFSILGIKVGEAARGILQPLKNLVEGPLVDLKNRINSFFTTVKLMYAGVTTWLALPNILLIYSGWQLRKPGSRRSRR